MTKAGRHKRVDGRLFVGAHTRNTFERRHLVALVGQKGRAPTRTYGLLTVSSYTERTRPLGVYNAAAVRCLNICEMWRLYVRVADEPLELEPSTPRGALSGSDLEEHAYVYARLLRGTKGDEESVEVHLQVRSLSPGNSA
eukprot:1176289-Prorocentrum_minimum.AAC.1